MPLEQTGRVETLPTSFQPHWAWVTDFLLERATLVDLDEGGRLLGMISTGYGSAELVFSRRRDEIYVPETYFARKSRGERSDVLSLYDARKLSPLAEVALPAKRALNALPYGNVAISDDERFVAVFNMTPATSLSIVDVEQRRFAGEIATPGCSLVYAAGPRRFLLLCMDGAMLVVELDEQGREARKERSRIFFDPLKDPVMEKAVRWGERWVFVSFDGRVHVVQTSGRELAFEEPWLLTELPDAEDSWRVGGIQPLALHAASGRLYCLMHRGPSGSHKDPGTEVWVYDLEARERIQRIRLKSPGLTVMGQSLEFGRGWIWPFHRLYDALLGALPMAAVQSIQVTQDEAPVLLTSGQMAGSLALYDAREGDFRGRVLSGNFTTHALLTPSAPMPQP